jgi:UDPglucose 6-dehydrogenase
MLAEICEAVGAEWREIAPALRLDGRIGPYAYLTPGLGIAGGNLRRDLITIHDLAERHETDASLIDVWLESSQRRRDWALREVRRRVVDRFPSPAIGVWGLAYKENTNSTKNSPALSLIEALPDVPVKAFDPGVPDDLQLPARVHRVDAPLEVCHDADALVIMTAWPEFKAVDLRQIQKSLRHLVLIDPWGIADRVTAEQLGFEYVRLGSGPRTANRSEPAASGRNN